MLHGNAAMDRQASFGMLNIADHNCSDRIGNADDFFDGAMIIFELREQGIFRIKIHAPAEYYRNMIAKKISEYSNAVSFRGMNMNEIYFLFRANRFYAKCSV